MQNGLYITADEALKMLRDGNKKYRKADRDSGDISKEIRIKTCNEGQHPYAVIVTCSDSRVIPEAIFRAGIGELFVIRVAGNVIDRHQLGSVEYALSHLGCKLVVVLGHTHCGAVDAAINHEPDSYIKFITDSIRKAVGDEKNEAEACRMNARYSASMIEKGLDAKELKKDGVKVVAALYKIKSGKVEFLTK